MFKLPAAMRRRILPALLILTGLSFATFSVPAEAYSPPFASIVVDVKAGRILHEENADDLRYPASITKVMTLFIVFERLNWGQIALSTPMRVSARAAAEPPSKLGLRAGATITVEQAIKALVTRSANDAATVIAEHLGGSVEDFARIMTRKARKIGMDRTVFRNAHGLPDEQQVTTARDLAILAVAIQDRFPDHYKYFQTRNFKFGKVTHGNHNRLLGRVTGVDGIKTGFIRASGFNLMTNARADGRHIVTIVLGGRTGSHRDQIVTRLVEQNLPTALAGDRLTPRTGFARAAAHAIVAAPAATPPLRPDASAIAVAQVEPEQDAAAADEGPIEAFASMRPQAGEPAGEINQQDNGEPAEQTAEVSAKAASAQVPVPEAPPPGDDAPEGSIAQRDLAEDAQSEPVELAAIVPLPPPAPPRPEKKAESKPFAIQLSAATSEAAALAILERARAAVGDPLKEAEPVTEKVVSGKSTFYRARFGGFADIGEAQAACKQAQRAGFDCFQTRI